MPFARVESDIEATACKLWRFFMPTRLEGAKAEWIRETPLPVSCSAEKFLRMFPGKLPCYPLEAPKAQAI